MVTYLTILSSTQSISIIIKLHMFYWVNNGQTSHQQYVKVHVHRVTREFPSATKTIKTPDGKDNYKIKKTEITNIYLIIAVPSSIGCPYL